MCLVAQRYESQRKAKNWAVFLAVAKKKKQNLQSTEKTKGFGLGWLVKKPAVYTAFSPLNPLLLETRMSFYLLVQGEDLLLQRFISYFQGTEEGLSVLPAPAVS